MQATRTCDWLCFAFEPGKLGITLEHGDARSRREGDGTLGCKKQKARGEGEIPGEIDDVLGSARSRVAKHIAEAVAPLELVGQVGLASHEVIAGLCGPFKGDDDLCIHL